MPRYRLVVSMDLARCEQEGFIDTDEEMSEDELQEVARDHAHNHIEYWGELVEEKE